MLRPKRAGLKWLGAYSSSQRNQWFINCGYFNVLAASHHCIYYDCMTIHYLLAVTACPFYSLFMGSFFCRDYGDLRVPTDIWILTNNKKGGIILYNQWSLSPAVSSRRRRSSLIPNVPMTVTSSLTKLLIICLPRTLSRLSLILVNSVTSRPSEGYH